MSGTVTYMSEAMMANTEIYNGSSAKTWKMSLKSGAFPSTPYKITRAVLKINISSVYNTDRHMVVKRENGEQLGDVSTGAGGVRELQLLTSAGYEGITSVKLDGVERWACQLRAGSCITILVYWVDEEPIAIEPPDAPEPIVITGIESTGESGFVLHSEVAVSFDGVDISEPINEGLLSLSFTDNEEDEADDLQIKLQDKTNKWLTQWLNDTMQQAVYGIKSSTKGMTISAGVKQFWPDGTIRSADFGFFELDELKSSGPPSQILIKGTSLSYANGIRTEERDKSWENYTLRKIGEEIADKGRLGFLYDCPKDPSYSRVEQTKQTDIAFLMQLCHDNGFSLKISGLKLIIFDQARYESMTPYTTIRWMDGTYTKYDLQTQDGDTHYDQCTVIYYDAASGTRYEGIARSEDYDEEATEHTVCTITDRKVGSAAEAGELAAKILRLHNKYEKRVNFTMVGNPMLGAGMTIDLEGFGLWDEKYIVKTCKHEVSHSGYTTKITLRTIPEGNVLVVKTEEVAESSGGNTTSSSSSNVKKEWRTKVATSVYKASTGEQKVGIIAAGQKVDILSGIKNYRRLVAGKSVTGYVPTVNLEYVDVNTPYGTGVESPQVTIVNGQVVYL